MFQHFGGYLRRSWHGCNFKTLYRVSQYMQKSKTSISMPILTKTNGQAMFLCTAHTTVTPATVQHKKIR